MKRRIDGDMLVACHHPGKGHDWELVIGVNDAAVVPERDGRVTVEWDDTPVHECRGLAANGLRLSLLNVWVLERAVDKGHVWVLGNVKCCPYCGEELEE
jgi:hypothetical protein